MKKVIVPFLIILAFIYSCSGPTSENKANSGGTSEQEADVQEANKKYPIINFHRTKHDFGEVKQGEKVKHTFTFKNDGDADLIIESARASCGCTVPEYSKKPVAPGALGWIDVSFNTAGRTGNQRKTIRVSTNTKEKIVRLTITALVKAPKPLSVK